MKPMLKFYFSLFLLLVSTACNAEVTAPPTATIIPTFTPPVFVTATLPATQTLLPSPVPDVAPTATSIPPAEGQTTSQVNVRNAPSADSEQIGMVEIFAKVKILGKNAAGGWWMIDFPESPSGRGWITGKFVKVADSSAVPVIDTMSQDGEQVSITGSSSNTSEPIPSVVPTPNLVTAPEDGDSAEAPAINITLSEASVPVLNYRGEVSSPNGDADDWVRFSLEGQSGQEQIVSVITDCFGSSNLNLTLLQNGVPLQSWENINCGRRNQLQLYLFVGAPYSLRVFPEQGGAALKYLSYTITVQLVK